VRRAAIGAAVLAAAGCTAAPIDVGRLPMDSLRSGLVAHWTFDEGAGDVLRDHSGNHHDGAIAGATWTDGQFSGALHFVAGNDVTVPAFQNATGSWSVSVWVRIASGEVIADYVTLVSTEIAFTGGWEVNAIFDSGRRRYHFGYWVGPSQSDYDYAECDCFVADRWVHVAAVVDEATTALRFYVDGKLAKKVTIRDLIRGGSPVLYMGSWSDPSTPRLLTGALDDVAVWSRALVPEEVAALAAGPAPSVD
jgi:Concanavalin A-like lectin/glucanases superfamily